MQQRISDWDYNEAHDFIYFSGDQTDYSYSMNCNDTVFDIDKFGHIIGISMHNASQRLCIPKEQIKNVSKFEIKLNVIDKENIHLKITSTLQIDLHKGNYEECKVRDTFKIKK